MPASHDRCVWDAEIPPLLSEIGASSPQLIKSWRWIIGESYSSPTAVLKTIVRRLYWIKNAAGLEHEYLLAVVEVGDGEQHVFRFERAPSRRRVPTHKHLKPHSSQHIPDAIQAPISLLLDRKRKTSADDTVTLLRSTMGLPISLSPSASLVASYCAFSSPLSLRDLAFAAYRVSAHSEAYLILEHQCYWFTRTLVALMIRNYVPREIRGEAFERRGTYSLTCCLPFSVNVDNPEEVTEISGKLLKDIKENDMRIYKKYMAGPGGKAIEKERADNEERLRLVAEEEERKARALLALLAEKNQRMRQELADLSSMMVNEHSSASNLFSH